MNLVEKIIKKRTPKTVYNLIGSIRHRFSPRVFSSDKIPAKHLEIIFEASRLAPSGRNYQPWFFYWISKGSNSYKKIISCIPEGNRWAFSAPIIIIACYDETDSIDKINKWAKYDLGASVISMIFQAQELGYYCRQIGSFDSKKTKDIFNIPESLTPFILITLGKIGTNEDYKKTDKEIIEKELSSWNRKKKIAQELA
jgi:nitroreductase